MGVMFKQIPRVIFNHRAVWVPFLLPEAWACGSRGSPNTSQGSRPNTMRKPGGRNQTRAYFAPARTKIHATSLTWFMVGEREDTILSNEIMKRTVFLGIAWVFMLFKTDPCTGGDVSVTDKQIMYKSYTPTGTGIKPKRARQSGIDCAKTVSMMKSNHEGMLIFTAFTPPIGPHDIYMSITGRCARTRWT